MGLAKNLIKSIMQKAKLNMVEDTSQGKRKDREEDEEPDIARMQK